MALEVNWICNIEVNSTWKVYLEVTWMGSVFGIRIMDIEVTGLEFIWTWALTLFLWVEFDLEIN